VCSSDLSPECLFPKVFRPILQITGADFGIRGDGEAATVALYKELAGARRMVEFCRQHRIPHEICGKIVVATTEAELPALEELLRRGQANGLTGVAEIGPERIKEIEREAIYNEYTTSLGEIVVGEIYQIRKGKGEILVIHNKNELILPRGEQIYKERYKKGDTIRAIVKEVRKGAGNPVVIISRTDPQFLMRLFEIEIPEIYDGIIEIKAIAREPGDRAKVAVLSHDDRIDAVGACVGMKGVRIHAIVRELNNENIDVINWSDDPLVFITRSLSPAKLKEIQLDKENKKANVTVVADQVSLAIGKNGQNVRLASKLSGFDIQLIKEGGEEEEYDMDLSEFREELSDVMFHKFFDEGYETVRDVIDAPIEELVNTLGIEKEKIEEIVGLLKKGLEDAEIEEAEDGGQGATPATASLGEGTVEKPEPSTEEGGTASESNEVQAAAEEPQQPATAKGAGDGGKQPL
jgi:N utilization substance protein A